MNGRMAAVVKSAIVLLAAVSLTAACGYALVGRGSTLPAHIKIIAVTQFENQTPEPELDTRLTDAVRQELLGRGRFKVVPTIAGADAVLSGKIRTSDSRPMAFTDSRQASRYEITIAAESSSGPGRNTTWAAARRRPI
jgi:outer membrane lipopolysaccharide assembly protein LptE/RlpB